MGSKDKRFKVLYEEGGFTAQAQVLQDRETGVCYLFYLSGGGAGLTPLLGPDGKPLVQAVYEASGGGPKG